MLFRTSNTKDGKNKLGTSEVLCRAKILAVKMISNHAFFLSLRVGFPLPPNVRYGVNMLVFRLN